MIREMTKEDIPQMCELAAEFIDESGLGVVHDFYRTQTTFELILDTAPTKMFVATLLDGLTITGFLLCSMDHSFCRKPWLMMAEFWVRPEERGVTGVADDLVEAFVGWGEELGVSHVFAASTARVSAENNAKFEGLFKKHGFSILGPTLCFDMESTDG